MILTNAGAQDKLPEVSRQFYGFNAPGQLVLRCGDAEEIIYDCFEQSRPCVPFDAMTSLDGKKIAFAVYSSDETVNGWYDRVDLPNLYLGSKNADSRIYIYHTESKQLQAWPHVKGQRDTSPVWLPDGRMMFTSDRNGQWRPWLNKITPKASQDPRLFTARPDGSDVVDVSPHAAGVMHPYVLKNGRVAIGTLWYSHNLAYKDTNGGINWPGTLDNQWVLEDVDYQGGDSTTLLGGHKNTIKDGNGRTKTMKALHFMGQRINGDLCVGNYYRANNLGLGDVWCFPLQPKGMEGPVPSFIPKGAYNLANWSKSNDTSANIGQGKIGWPEGTSDDQVMMTVGQGICTQFGSTVQVLNSLTNQIGCDTGIYKTTVIPSKAISDLELIVDRPEWHEFNARMVTPRDVDLPVLSTTEDGSCELASSDAGSTDAHNYKPYRFNKNYPAMANNGGEIQGLDHAELSAIRFYEVLPNLSKYTIDRPRNHMGNDVRLLGDVPLLEDKSFKVRLPCNTPYLMAGVDKDGRIIKRDQLAQSLRPGERRTCNGCHLHGEEGRPYEQSMAFSAKAVELLVSKPVPTFEQNIKPIFQQKCTTCHVDDVPVLEYEKLVWDYFQDYVPDNRKVPMTDSDNERRKHGLQRPYTSKYVNNMFARESLLYWKAANKRTDGRSDDTYDNDIDFGQDHPTDITSVELKAIGAWLDSGAAK